jgi:site-specific DNA recombinase
VKQKRQGKRAVGYVRVSDESQVDGHSLDAQRNEIARWCERHGYELVGFYCDEGRTAYTDRIERRPALVRLLADADADAFDIAVVHTLDRWARNSTVQATTLEHLGKRGIGFASVMEQIDYTTPAGKMVLTTLGAAQEFFSAQSGVHVSKSHRHKASRGLAVGPLPFAYVPGEDGVPTPHPDEAAALLRGFHQRDNGASYGAIARALDADGFRTRTGRRFTAHAVKDLMKCRFLAGFVRCGDDEYQGKHEPIVPLDLFERVQRQRQHRSKAVRTPSQPRGVLQGRIGCVRCGNALHSDRQYRSGLPMYRERHALDCETNNRALLSEPVDAQVGHLLTSLALPDGWRDRIATLAAKRGSRRVGVAALDEERRRVGKAYVNGAYANDDEYEAKLAEIEARRRLAQPATAIRVDECMALLQDLAALWGEATLEERGRLIAPLIERAYVDVETKGLCAITPAEGFDSLLRGVLEQPDRSACFLLSAEVANQPDWWTWWRRGGIEPPVQVTDALSILQAYPDS